MHCFMYIGCDKNKLLLPVICMCVFRRLLWTKQYPYSEYHTGSGCRGGERVSRVSCVTGRTRRVRGASQGQPLHPPLTPQHQQ